MSALPNLSQGKKPKKPFPPHLEATYETLGMQMEMGRVYPSNAAEAEAMVRKSLKKNAGIIKRPSNQFMLFQNSFKATWKSMYGGVEPAIPQQVVTRISTKRWDLTSTNRQPWKTAQELLKEAHKKLHPNYEFKPKKKKKSGPQRKTRRNNRRAEASSSSDTGRRDQLQESIPVALNEAPYTSAPPFPPQSPPLWLPTPQLPSHGPAFQFPGQSEASDGIDWQYLYQGPNGSPPGRSMLQEVNGYPGLLFFEDELADVEVFELPDASAPVDYVEHTMQQSEVMSAGDFIFGAPAADQNYVDGTGEFWGSNNHHYNGIGSSFSGSVNNPFLNFAHHSEENWY